MSSPIICIFNPVTSLIDQVQSSSIAVSGAGIPVVTDSTGHINASLIPSLGGVTAIAGEAINNGALVNLYEQGGTLKAQNAYAATTGTAPSGTPYPVPAVGFSTSPNTSAPGQINVAFSGLFTFTAAEFTSSSVGQPVYVSATNPGAPTLTSSPSLPQVVGIVATWTAPNTVQILFVTTPPASVLFNNIGSGTNTSSTMTVGTGASLTVSGTGVINATQIQGNAISATAPTIGQALIWSGTAWTPTASSTANFADILGGINMGQTMTVGTGSTLTFGGTGIVNASTIYGVALSGTAPTVGQVLTATSGTTAQWSTPAGGTPGTPTGSLQWNSAGTFAGATNSSVSGSGAIVLGNTPNSSPTASTALTISAAGGIAVSATDWYSSNEGTIVAQMLADGRMICNGVSVISNVSIGAFPALSVVGGNAGSPDVADFSTHFPSTKVVWIDYTGNLHNLLSFYDSTGSPGTSGEVLSSTVTGTAWVPAGGGGGTPGGSPTQIQYNLAGAFAGIAGSAVTTAGAVTLAPTGTGVGLSITGDSASSNILNLYANGAVSPAVSISDVGALSLFSSVDTTVTNDLTNLLIYRTLTNNTGTGGPINIGLEVIANYSGTANPSASATISNAIISETAMGTSDSIQLLYGLEIAAFTGRSSTSNVLSSIVGIPLSVGHFSTGTCAALAGIEVGMSGDSQVATVTDMYGIWIQAPVLTGSFTGTNNIGLQVDNPATGTFTNTYAIKANGAVGITPTGTSVALSVTGDATGSDISDFYSNTGVPGYTGNVQSGTALGVQITKYGAMVVSPTGSVTGVGEPGASLTAYVDSPSARVIQAFGTGSLTSPSFYVLGSGGVFCASSTTNDVSLTVEGAPGSAAIQIWEENGGAPVAYFDQYGDLTIQPDNAVAPSSVAALTVAGDSQGDHIADFYTNSLGENVVSIQDPAHGAVLTVQSTPSNTNAIAEFGTNGSYVMLTINPELSGFATAILTGDGTSNTLDVYDNTLAGNPVFTVLPANGNSYAPAVFGQGSLSGDYQLGVATNATADTPHTDWDNFVSSLNVNVPVSSSNGWTGITSRVNVSGTGTYNSEPIEAIFADVISGTTGALDALVGLEVSAAQAGASPSLAALVCAVDATASVGTVANGSAATNVRVIQTSTGLANTCTATQLAHVYIQSPGGVIGTVTNNYGLYIEDQTTPGAGGTLTNTWAIYVAGGVSSFTGVATAISTQTTTYTAGQNDHTILCNGTFTLTLPTTGLKVGQEFYIKNISTGTITISSAVNIDFATSTTLSAVGQSIIVQWDGTQWWIF